MLAIRDHVESTNETMDDINTISENDARDTILSESRSLEFTEIIDILKNVHNDYNEVTGRFGNKPMTQEEKETLGTMYLDYIPLSKVVISSKDEYTYRVPFEVIKKVILAKAGKRPHMSFRTFNKHLENMPTKFMRGISRRGQERDIELKLDQEQHNYFCKNLKPLLVELGNKKTKKLEKTEVKEKIVNTDIDNTEVNNNDGNNTNENSIKDDPFDYD